MRCSILLVIKHTHTSWKRNLEKWLETSNDISLGITPGKASLESIDTHFYWRLKAINSENMFTLTNVEKFDGKQSGPPGRTDNVRGFQWNLKSSSETFPASEVRRLDVVWRVEKIQIIYKLCSGQFWYQCEIRAFATIDRKSKRWARSQGRLKLINLIKWMWL